MAKKNGDQLFEFLKSINFSKLDVMDSLTEKDYKPFVINRFLVAADTLFHVHEVNVLPHLDARMQYDYLRLVIRKRKRFRKFPKAAAQIEAIEIVKKYYDYNDEKAKSVLPLLSDSDLKRMAMEMSEGGLVK